MFLFHWMQAPTAGAAVASPGVPSAGVYVGPTWNAGMNSYTWTDLDGRVHLWRQVSW